MLSAHQPFETYPALIREAARALGATAQVAGGVPAMCDGVTQGRAGMELSLFSRDVIAQATAIALSHDMFDGAVYLGVCDKIVPGLLIGALAFGHLPAVFIPAGPMTPGIPNKLKAEVRERYAAGEATREELLEAEASSYHAPGTCTFYGTANSNQVLLEAMGVQLPGASFVNPGTPLRDALTHAATERALRITALGADYRPLGRLIDEHAIVNAIAALMATGGSTNHTIHWVAVARAAGIALTWDDIDAISQAVPLLARVYPNGDADVNRFAACGGTQFVFRELLDAGLMHADIATVVPGGMRAYCDEPRLAADGATGGPPNNPVHWVGGARAAGIGLTWDDIEAISQAVPLLARVYPNGDADVNRVAACGGTQFVFRELLDAGLMHADIATVVPGGMRAYCDESRLAADGTLDHAPGIAASADETVVRPASAPFEAQGGLRLLRGNLGSALTKLSAVKPEFRSITAPAVVVDAPQLLNRLHAAGALPRDFVADRKSTRLNSSH